MSQANVNQFTVVLTQVWMFLLFSSLQVPAKNILSLDRLRREPVQNAEIEKIVAKIEKLANELSLDRFLDGQLTTQIYDESKSTTTYTSVKYPSVVFKRGSLDDDRGTIVLSEGEDNLPQVPGAPPKRVYIVMKKNPKAKKSKHSQYFIFYAYLRNAYSDENGDDVIQIGNGKYLVEWDSWDNRGVQTKSKLLGWLSCTNSVFFSCILNHTEISNVALKKNETFKYGGKLKSSLFTKIQAGLDEYDENEFYPFFADLDEYQFLESMSASLLQKGRSMFASTCDNECVKKQLANKSLKGINGRALISDAEKQNKLISNINVTFGTFFEGFQGAAGVFIPRNKGMACMFVLDNDDTENMPLIHGLLYTATDAYNPLTYIPDKMSMVRNLKSLKGVMVPDSMMVDGGIRGTLSARPNGAIFISDVVPTNFDLDPTTADPEKVFYPVNLMNKVANKATPAESIGNSNHDSAESFATEKKENYGVYYEGSTPVFIPNGNPMTGFLLAAENVDLQPVLGTFYPAVGQNNDSIFDPADAESSNIAAMTNQKVKFVPELIMKQTNAAKDIKIEIKGIYYLNENNPTGTNGTFKPDIPGKEWFFDPKNPAEGVWSPNIDVLTENKTTPSDNIIQNSLTDELVGQSEVSNTSSKIDFVEGIYFYGSLPKYGIFIPENEGVPGTIIPVNIGDSTVKGIFYSGKPNMPASFYPDDAKQLIKSNSFPVMFTAEGINHHGQNIPGICTSNPDNSELTFWPGTPSKAYLYDASSTNDSLIWTPYIPGISETTTERYNARPSKHLSSEEETAAVDATMYGHLFKEPGGEEGIFMPFDIPIIGTIVFSNRKYPKIPGKMTVSKNGKPPMYIADDIALASTLINVRGIYMPDALPRIYGGIRGYFTGGNPAGSFRTDIAGQFHIYEAAKDEDEGIWKPVYSSEDSDSSDANGRTVMPKNGPTAVTAMMHSFVLGSYFQVEQSKSPIFIPKVGKSGFLTVAKPPYKVHGLFYAEQSAKFVSDDGVIKIDNKTVVKFLPDMKRGEPAVSVVGTLLLENKERPTVFIPTASYVHCWSNFRVPNPPSKTFNYSIQSFGKNQKWKNIPSLPPIAILKNGIAVGGGYKGYQTQGRSYEGLVEATNPIFKEFLELRTSSLARAKGKYMEVPMNVLLTVGNNSPNKSFDFESISRNLEVISSSEYESWLKENYLITKTQIKTDNIDQAIEMGVPVSAKSYLKIKPKPKKKKFNVIIDTQASAASSADATTGDKSSNSARGGVTTKIGNCKAKTTSANAVALASNGSSAESKATAKNGGVANALSMAKDGSQAKTNAEAADGGVTNSKAAAASGGKASSSANSVGSGQANAIANSLTSGKQIDAVASAKANKTAETPSGDSCQEESFLDEIVVESSAVANAIAEDGKSTGTSMANTQVRVDLAGLVAKLMTKEDESDDEESETVDIHINAKSHSQSGRKMLGLFGIKPKLTGQTKSTAPKNAKPGWKTSEFVDIVPGVILQRSDEIFYGFGTCPYEKKVYSELLKKERPEDIIDFYLTILRTGCKNKEKVQTLLLVVDSLLEFDDKTLVVPSQHSFLKEPKLTINEMASLSRAYEISMFTKTYVWFGEKMALSDNLSLNITQPYSPDGSKISKSLMFLTEYTLMSLEERIKYFPLHFVRLTRNNVMTLRTALTKLNMDKKRLEPCEECHLDKEENFNDRFQIVALIQFLFHGLSPVSHGVQDTTTAFNFFYIKNKAAIREIVDIDYFL